MDYRDNPQHRARHHIKWTSFTPPWWTNFAPPLTKTLRRLQTTLAHTIAMALAGLPAMLVIVPAKSVTVVSGNDLVFGVAICPRWLLNQAAKSIAALLDRRLVQRVASHRPGAW